MKLLHAALLVAAADAARRRGAVSVTATEPPSPEDDAKTKQTVKAPKGCLLYTSDACRRYSLCRSRWSPYH